METLRQHTSDALENFRQYTSDALREFQEHPLQYTSSAVKDFVKDYWDMAAALAGGFALGDVGEEYLGAARHYVTAGGITAALAGVYNPFSAGGFDDERLNRNAAAGIGSAAAFWDGGVNQPLNVQHALGALVASAAILFERRRRANNPKPETTPETLDAVLE